MLYLQKAERRRKRMYGVPIVVEKAAVFHPQKAVAERTYLRVERRRGSLTEALHLPFANRAAAGTAGTACADIVGASCNC